MGEKSAGQELVAGGPAVPLVTEEQLSFDDVSGNGALTAMQVAEAKRRGPGRPAGAKNRATEEWRSYLLRRYGSPLEALAATYSRPVHVLAAELGCTMAEAFDMQMRAARDLAPYVHGKMPLEVTVTEQARCMIVMALGDGDGGPVIDGDAMLLPGQESPENGDFSEGGE